MSASPAKSPAKAPAKSKDAGAPAKKVPAKKAAAKKAPAKKLPPAKKAPPPVPAVKEEKAAKAPKAKLVRDSFTIPKTEYGVIDELKTRAAKLGSPAKKSEVLRAGVKLLAALEDKALLQALAAVPAIKTGRPGKA